MGNREPDNRFAFLLMLFGFFIVIVSKTYLHIKKKQAATTWNEPETVPLDDAHGVIFGIKGRKVMISPEEEEGHIAVFGGSGSGKTSAVLIPTLQNWQGNFFVVDISGDIEKNVETEDKFVFNPTIASNSPYNIFAGIDELNDHQLQNEALERLSFQLMPIEPTMSDVTLFYTNEGRKILTASLITFYHQDYDFVQICELINSKSHQSLFSHIERSKNSKAVSYINSFSGTSKQTIASCKQAVETAIHPFISNSCVMKNVRRPVFTEPAFTPAILEEKSVFVCIPDELLEQLTPLLRIITAQTLDYFSSRKISSSTKTILFCLDEFSSFGKFNIGGALRKLRKRKIRIMVLTQSLSDIDLTYEVTERKALMDNFSYTLVLSARERESQLYFSSLIGCHDKVQYSTSRSPTQVTTTESTTRDWIVSPEELSRLGDDLILIYEGGFARLQKNYYFD